MTQESVAKTVGMIAASLVLGLAVVVLGVGVIRLCVWIWP